MDNTAKISCCNICLLTNMADCKNCPFNPAHLKLSPAEQAQVKHTELLKQDGNK